MWLGHAAVMSMPSSSVLTRSSAMLWIAGSWRRRPSWLSLTPGVLESSCAVSFVAGFLSAMASLVMVVLLAGAAASDGWASRCSCCAASAGACVQRGPFNGFRLFLLDLDRRQSLRRCLLRNGRRCAQPRGHGASQHRYYIFRHGKSSLKHGSLRHAGPTAQLRVTIG